MRLTLAALLLLIGCAEEPTVPDTATAIWTPCPTQVPVKPAFPAETLTGKEDVFTIGKTFYADMETRIAYELELRARLEGCTGANPPAGH